MFIPPDLRESHLISARDHLGSSAGGRSPMTRCPPAPIRILKDLQDSVPGLKFQFTAMSAIPAIPAIQSLPLPGVSPDRAPATRGFRVAGWNWEHQLEGGFV